MSAVEHDAQRRLEQQSLRNVRALVDKLEREESTKPGLEAEIIVILALLALVLVLFGGAVLLKKYRSQPPAPMTITSPR